MTSLERWSVWEWAIKCIYDQFNHGFKPDVTVFPFHLPRHLGWRTAGDVSDCKQCETLEPLVGLCASSTPFKDEVMWHGWSLRSYMIFLLLELGIRVSTRMQSCVKTSRLQIHPRPVTVSRIYPCCGRPRNSESSTLTDPYISIGSERTIGKW